LFSQELTQVTMAGPDQGLVHATRLALGSATVVFLSLLVASGFVLWNAETDLALGIRIP
jgi:hypothetical protein